MRIALREIQVGVSKPAVTKRTGDESRPVAGVTNERKLEPVGSEVRKFFYAIRPEVMKFSLFAVGNDGRAGGLASLNCVADGFLIKGIQLRIVAVHLLKGLDQLKRPGNTANRLGGNDHWEVEVRKCCEQIRLEDVKQTSKKLEI